MLQSFEQRWLKPGIAEQHSVEFEAVEGVPNWTVRPLQQHFDSVVAGFVDVAVEFVVLRWVEIVTVFEVLAFV